jgi:hypothetical protein
MSDMNQRFSACLLVLFIILACFLSFFVAGTESIGVATGDKFVFIRKFIFTSNGPTMNDVKIDSSILIAQNNTTFKTEVTYVASLYLNVTQDLKNYTIIPWGYIWGDSVFFLGGLKPNDKLYPSSGSDTYTKIVVNETQTVSYPSGQREINHANYTIGTGKRYLDTNFNVVSYENMFFDKITGVATHIERLHIYTNIQDPSKYCTFHETRDLIESSVWNVDSANHVASTLSPSVPELPTLATIGLFMVLVSISLLGVNKKIRR